MSKTEFKRVNLSHLLNLKFSWNGLYEATICLIATIDDYLSDDVFLERKLIQSVETLSNFSI